MTTRVIGSIMLVLVTLGWSTHAADEQASGPRGELRVVDSSRYNFISVVFNTFEHLMEFEEGRLVPRLATSWRWLDDRTFEVTLRQGVTFHNGEVFDAAIVKLNWDENVRLEQPFMAGQMLNFNLGSCLEIVAPYTVRFQFPEPDGAALYKISTMHMGNRQFYAEHGWGEKHW